MSYSTNQIIHYVPLPFSQVTSTSRSMCGRRGCHIDGSCDCEHRTTNNILKVNCSKCLAIIKYELGLTLETPVGVIYDFVEENGVELLIKRYL